MTTENLTVQPETTALVRATNPYPVALYEKQDAWQEGYEAGWNEAKSVIQNINAEAGDLRLFERMVLLAFIPVQERRKHVGYTARSDYPLLGVQAPV